MAWNQHPEVKSAGEVRYPRYQVFLFKFSALAILLVPESIINFILIIILQDASGSLVLLILLTVIYTLILSIICIGLYLHRLSNVLISDFKRIWDKYTRKGNRITPMPTLPGFIRYITEPVPIIPSSRGSPGVGAATRVTTAGLLFLAIGTGISGALLMIIDVFELGVVTDWMETLIQNPSSIAISGVIASSLFGNWAGLVIISIFTFFDSPVLVLLLLITFLPSCVYAVLGITGLANSLERLLVDRVIMSIH